MPGAAHWAVGLCALLSSKVIERTTKLVGCGLLRGLGLAEDEDEEEEEEEGR